MSKPTNITEEVPHGPHRDVCGRCAGDPLAGGRERLLNAAEVAQRLNVDRAWVYANAAKLGALRLGDGPRARLRFDPRAVRAALRPLAPARAGTSEARSPRRRRAQHGTAPLLPIKGGRQ